MSILDNQEDKKFFSVYPSLNNIYKKYERDSKGCSNCKKNRLLKQFKSTVHSIEESETVILSAHPSISEEMFEFFMKDYERNESCEDCMLKHLSTALVLITEVVQGYTGHLHHAWSEIKQAYKEGFRERIDLNNIIDTKEKILEYLEDEDPDVLTIGALNSAEEFCCDEDLMNRIREIRIEISDEE